MDNIKNFTSQIEGMGREQGNQYAYCAGYYESLLGQLAKDIPEVAEYIQRRVDFLTNQKKAA